MRSALRGASLEAQLQMLAPRASGGRGQAHAGGTGNARPGHGNHARTPPPEQVPTEGLQLEAYTDYATAGGSQRNRGRFGPGEEVWFRANLDGEMVAPAGQLSFDGGRNQWQWVAPSEQGSYTLTYTTRGQNYTKVLRVVHPTEMTFSKAREASPGTRLGVLMDCHMAVHPNDVSFQHLTWQEEFCDAEGQRGFWAPGANPWPDNPNRQHVPGRFPLDVLRNNRLGGHDQVMTKSNAEPQELPSGRMGWREGFYQWNIPYVFRLPNGGFTERRFNLQKHFMEYGTGKVTVSKDAARAERSPDPGPPAAS